MGTIEINPGANPITGTITAAAVQDLMGVAPTTIIHLNNPWQVKVDWQLDGSGLNMLSGSWEVTLVLEGMGNIFEGVIGSDSTKQIAAVPNGGTATPNRLSYTCLIPVAANLVPDAGVYKLVTVITSKDPQGAPGSFAGFEEGPMLQFYK